MFLKVQRLNNAGQTVPGKSSQIWVVPQCLYEVVDVEVFKHLRVGNIELYNAFCRQPFLNNWYIALCCIHLYQESTQGCVHVH